MAFWQYSFWVVPKHALVGRYGHIPKEISEDDFNNMQWFVNFNQVDKVIGKITYLEPNEHWDKETVFFGAYDGDCISMMFDNNVLSEIRFRIDLRNNNLPILDCVTKLLCDFDLMIIDEDMRVIDPGSDVLIQMINKDINKKNIYFER